MTPHRELNLGANPDFFWILFCFKGRYFAHGIDLPQLRFGPTNGMLGQTKAATIMQFIEGPRGRAGRHAKRQPELPHADLSSTRAERMEGAVGLWY